MRALAVALLALVGAVVLFLWWGSTLPDPDPAERIRAACEREFPHNLEASQACEIRLSVEVLAKADADRMDRARRASK